MNDPQISATPNHVVTPPGAQPATQQPGVTPQAPGVQAGASATPATPVAPSVAAPANPTAPAAPVSPIASATSAAAQQPAPPYNTGTAFVGDQASTAPVTATPTVASAPVTPATSTSTQPGVSTPTTPTTAATQTPEASTAQQDTHVGSAPVSAPNGAAAVPAAGASVGAAAGGISPSMGSKKKPEKKKSSGGGHGIGKIVGLVIAVLLFLGIGTGVFGYFVAYDHVSTGNESLDKQISHAFMSVPLFPKTKEYILERSALEHQKVSSANIDMSVAVQGDQYNDQFEEMLGGAFEMQVSGPVEFTDPDNPSFALNLKLTQEFDADVTVLDKVAYMRLNKIPAILYAFIGLNPDNIDDNPLMNRWVSYDVSGLETEAMDAIDESQEKADQAQADSIVEQKLMELNDKFLPVMELSVDTVDGKSMHKFSMDLDNQEIQTLAKDIAEIMGESEMDYDPEDLENVKRIEMTMLIDQQTYYMEKMSLVMTVMVPDDYGAFSVTPAIEEEEAPSDTVQVAVVLKMKDLGQSFDIQKPADSVDFETFMLDLSEFFSSSYEPSPSLYEPALDDDPLFTEFELETEGEVQGATESSVLGADVEFVPVETEPEWSPFQEWVLDYTR